MYRSYPNPWSSSGSTPPSVAQKASMLIGKPVGISLANGQGVSGVLCSIENGEIFVLQYLYAFQFATFHYALQDVKDILPFPPCMS